MSYYIVGGGNILPLYDIMPYYSVISGNKKNYTDYLENNMPNYIVDSGSDSSPEGRNALITDIITGNKEMYISASTDKNPDRLEYILQLKEEKEEKEDIMPYYSVISGYPEIIKLQNSYHLFSFAYQDVYNKLESKLDEKFIIIDSGGYSIHTQGLDLDIDDYIKFLRKARYKYAFNFDVIGDPESTYQNQKYIEEAGFNVIPVFHLGSKYRYLQQYIDEGYTYISLGNMVGKHNKYRESFLNNCFTLGQKNQIKFHGLGLGHNYCSKYPLFSIDNSNHIMVRRIGKLKIKGQEIKIPRVQGETKEERKWNDAQPVLMQLIDNIREYKKIVKENWLKYHRYFQGNLTYEEIIG